MSESSTERRHIVIVGAGFGGLFAARTLGKAGYRVTLLDKRNFQLFQPLLYQVATGGLTPGDICVPLRVLFHRRPNVSVRLGTAYDVDPERRVVYDDYGEIGYDTLIVATGSNHDYFGNDRWREFAPGLKTIEHALEMRRRIFNAFERAENEPDPDKRKALMTFVVVGAGPTGVELAGSLAETAKRTMVGDFRAIDSRDARVVLVEGVSQVLPRYPESLAESARRSLEKIGVEVVTGTLVSEIDDEAVTLKCGDEETRLPARTVLWAAGVKSSAFGDALSERTAAERDRAGKLFVEPDLSLPGHPDIYVIGDLAHIRQPDGEPVPWVAPAAIQEGRYVAERLVAEDRGREPKPFRYNDQGKMAVIGRRRAVADLKWFRATGFRAWALWVVIHIWALIQTEQKVRVMARWTWKYFTRKTGARLITGKPPNTRRLQKTRPGADQPVAHEHAAQPAAVDADTRHQELLANSRRAAPDRR